MFNSQLYRYAFLPETSAHEEAQVSEERIREGAEILELSADDLPAVCPHASMPLWASHPRVFLDVVNENEAMCPYCGTRHRLRANAPVHDHEFGARGMHQHRQRLDLEVATRNLPRAGRPAISDAKSQNLSADAFGNTRLELMTRWLRRGQS